MDIQVKGWRDCRSYKETISDLQPHNILLIRKIKTLDGTNYLCSFSGLVPDFGLITEW